MLQCLQFHPKMSYKKRREAIGLKMSDSYIRDLVIAKGLKHWRAKKRPELTPVVATERLLWSVLTTICQYIVFLIISRDNTEILVLCGL